MLKKIDPFYSLLFSLACFNLFTSFVAATPLDDYVNTPDDHYKYELLTTYNETGYKLYILNMTSQKWQNESVVTNPIWWHYLAVTIPDKLVIKDAGIVYISSGDNTDGFDFFINSITISRILQKF